MAASPYLVRKRILEDDGSLWGVLLWHQSKLLRLDISDLLGLISYFGKPVMTDVKGSDQPATVMVKHRKTKTGLMFYFTTVHDKIKGNNFNQIPAVTMNSARRYRLYKE
jgi:hypothetical protein